MAEAPISLYLDLEPGAIADLEVVSRAALAWASAIKELAFIIDPSLEVRIELASGTVGSLSLNSFIRDLSEKARKTVVDRTTLKAVAIAIILWFGEHGLEWTFDKVMDHLSGTEGHQSESFSAEQKKEIAEIVARVLKEQAAKPAVEQVYRELERDPAIKGVGASSQPGVRPKAIVPRSEFSERGGHRLIEGRATLRRERTEITRVMLVSPVLVPGTRRWRFRSLQGEFGAPVKDDEFARRALSGLLHLPLAEGIQMDVELQTVEEYRDGVWMPVEHTVLRVDKIYPPPIQDDLPLVAIVPRAK